MYTLFKNRCGVRLAKGAVLMLLFSFFPGPALVVFAQEGGEQVTTQSAPSTESTPTEPAPSADPVTEVTPTDPESSETPTTEPTPLPEPETQVPETEESTEPSTEEEVPVEPDSLLLLGEGEKSGGDAAAKKTSSPKISTFDGSFNYLYPLQVPPGRNGLQPDLVLSYDSSQGSDADIFGYGWDINIPYIQRLNKTGVENLYATSSSVFYSSISGELEQVGSTDEYRAKVETGDFLKYELDSNAWTITDKKGIVYKLGTTASSRQDNATSTADVYKWVVDEIRDTNDNYIEFSYYKDSGQIYPDTISYTGHDSTDGPFTVEFTRESRTDNVRKYDAGFSVVNNYRISTITAKVSGSWVRKYELDYTAGDNTLRSTLTSITESGTDGVTTVTLPVMAFQCENTASDGWVQQGPQPPAPFVYEGKDLGTRILDVNGDGLLDFVRFFKKNSTTIKKIYLNEGPNDGWVEDSNWVWSDMTDPFTIWSGYSAYNPHNDYGARFADVNGDGLTDVLMSHDGETSDINKVFINNGSGWYTDTSWTLPVFFTKFDNVALDNGARIGDINGDRLPDIIQAVWDNSKNLTASAYINTGTGFTMATSWTPPEPFTYCVGCTYEGKDLGTYLVDVNDDGLDDIVRGDAADAFGLGGTTTNRVYLNNGSNWVLDTSWSLPEYFVYNDNPSDRGLRFAEVNGDGLIDLVQNFTWSFGNIIREYYINTGEGWVSDEGQLPPSGTYFSDYQYGDSRGTRIADVNGDNVADIFYAYNNNSETSETPQTKIMHLNSRGIGDSIIGVTLPQGGQISVTYKGSQEYRDASDNLLNPDLPFSINTVSSISFNSGIGSPWSADTWSDTYSYEGGLYYYASSTLRDRKFAGFSAVTKTTPRTKERTYFHQGNTASTSVGEYADSFSQIGFAYRVDTSNTSNNLYKADFSKWETYDLGDDAVFVKNTQNLTLSYDDDGDHKDKAVTYDYDSSSKGDLTQKIEYGEVTGSTDGTFSDTGSDKFTTNLLYAASSTNDVMSLVSQASTTNQSGTKVKESKFYYDGQSLGTVLGGNLTKQEDWVIGSTYIDTERTYDSYGLVATSTDPRGNETAYIYDSNNLYPETVRNALLQDIDYTYDYSSGKVLTKTDENGRVFETKYDGLDRVKEEKVPNLSSPSSLVTKTLYEYTDDTVPTKIKTTSYLDSTVNAENYKYFDGFGHLIQERQEAETSNQYAVSDFVFVDGVLEKEEHPHFSTGSAITAPANTQYTQYTYDALLRKTKVDNLFASTTYAYDQWNTTVTDGEGNVKEYLKDAYDNLVEVVEHNGVSEYTTGYEYDYGRNLTKITDALGNIRNVTYDGLGRRTSLQDLHNTGDGTFGTWYFSYDDAGNIASTTNPKGQTVQYTYDNLNRALTENYTGVGGTEVEYGYDSCTEGIGRLCVATSSGAVSRYAYNAAGGIATETKVIDSTTYDTNYTYDRQGNIAGIVYPDDSEVRYTYNTAGQLETVEQKESGGLWGDVITDFDYNAANKLTFQLHANGASTTRSYDNLYRLTNILTTVSEGGGEGLMGGSGEGFLDGAVASFSAMLTSTEPSEAIAPTAGNKKTDKTREIVASFTDGEKVEREKYDIEIVDVQEIDKGVQIFVRAWDKEGKRVGFGKDGSVETERIRIFNPPVFVDDGTFREVVDVTGETILVPNRVKNPKEATLQGLTHTISVVGKDDKNIVQGKVGNTVSTFYPNANPESVSVDGFTEYFVDNGVWSTARDASTATVAGDTNTLSYGGGQSNGFPGPDYELDRAFFLFDTSAIPDTDGISSTTLSIYDGTNGNSNTNSITYHIVSSSPASNTAIGTADHDQIGSTSFGSKALSTFSNNTFANFEFNASGLAAISKTGVSKFAMRSNLDIDNSAPTGANRFDVTYADSASNDPKLVVEHSEDVAPPIEQSLQNISYTYDDVDNIIRIEDHSYTGTARTVLYEYDDLYRLTVASTTVASSTPYRQTYAYDAIGNITSKSDIGSYTYAETGYANPHAATSINGVTYAYDNNGNVTDVGASVDLTWDYMDRLTQWTDGGTTATYDYDHTTERMTKTIGATTTVYTNKYFDTDGTTANRYVYAGDTLVATVEDAGSPATYHVHVDHLGGTNVTTDEAGAVEQVLDYYPFGSTRIEIGATNFDEGRKYIGEFFDDESDLSYLNARYYDGQIGKFVSQDPVFLMIGSADQLKQAAQVDQNQLLMDPQLLNSYSYARNNPPTLKDPEGKIAFVPLLGYIYSAYSAAQIGIDSYDYINTNFRYAEVISQKEKNLSAFKLGSDLVMTAVGAKIGRDVSKVAEINFDTLTATLDILDTYLGEEIYGKRSKDILVNGGFVPSLYLNNIQTNGGYSNKSFSFNRDSQLNSIGSDDRDRLVSSLSRLISALKSYVASLSKGKDKKR